MFEKIIQNKRYIIIGVIIFSLGCAVGWHMSGGGYDADTGAKYQTFINELEQARRINDDITNELKRSSATIADCNRTIAKLEKGISRAETATSTATGILQQNDGIITEAIRINRENQSILHGILEGSQTENNKP